MRAASTRTARAVLAAEGQGPTATDGASGTTSTVDAAEPEPVAPDPTDSDPTDSEPAPAPATTVPAAPAATAPATAAPVPPVPSAGARFLAALSQVGRDLGAAMTAPLRPLADD